MKTLFCQKLKQQLPALNSAPYPGELGQQILKNISQPAWQQWLEHQTRMINENRLNLLKPQDREVLKTEMKNFLFGSGKVTEIQGHVPEQQ